MTEASDAEVPDGALAGLCLACGAVKPSCIRPCHECGTEPNQDPDVEAVFSEDLLHRTTLEQLSAVFRKLTDADVAKNLRIWTLCSFLRTSHPTVFTVRVPRRTQSKVDGIKRRYDLPPIEVQTSASVLPKDWDDHDAWDRYYAMWEPGLHGIRTWRSLGAH